MVRELCGAEVESFRQKGIDDAKKIIEKIPENMADKERCGLISTALNQCRQRCWEPLIDNFDPGEYFTRANDKKGSDLKLLLLGCFKAAAKMQTLAMAMGQINENTIDDRKVVFLQHWEWATMLDSRLETARKLYLGEIAAPTIAPASLQKERSLAYGH